MDKRIIPVSTIMEVLKVKIKDKEYLAQVYEYFMGYPKATLSESGGKEPYCSRCGEFKVDCVCSILKELNKQEALNRQEQLRQEDLTTNPDSVDRIPTLKPY